MNEFIHYANLGLEAAGIAVIVGGAILATGLFLVRFRRVGFRSGYRSYRADLGRGILLGLELLIAADILRSLVIDPTLHGIAVLAAIVAVRTFLSFSLEVEIYGHWPWQATRLAQEDRATGVRSHGEGTEVQRSERRG